MATKLDKAFKKNMVLTKIKGQWHCYCKAGLWSAIAPTKEKARELGKIEFEHCMDVHGGRWT